MAKQVGQIPELLFDQKLMDGQNYEVRQKVLIGQKSEVGQKFPIGQMPNEGQRS